MKYRDEDEKKMDLGRDRETIRQRIKKKKGRKHWIKENPGIKTDSR